MRVDVNLNIKYYEEEIRKHAQNGNEPQAQKMYEEVLTYLRKNPHICPEHLEDIKRVFAASLPPQTPNSEHITNFYN
ncbi:MAG: hypothetical protein KDK65_02255, partial [Chlamydiia bacterium]|nr:hypothetical protein [Chlamydiia bacterium]